MTSLSDGSLKTLRDFLEMPIESTDPVFARFGNEPGAIIRGETSHAIALLPLREAIVEHEQRRALREAAGQEGALQFAAGEGARVAVGQMPLRRLVSSATNSVTVSPS